MHRVLLPALAATVLAATAAPAATTYLNTIPGPDDTGGMIMPMVSLDFSAKSLQVSMMQNDPISLYPLQQYAVWGGHPYADAVFNPALSAEPWYDLLDPGRQHLPFSTRLGFELISANAHLIPASAYLYIKATDITAGLKLYDVGYWADVWEQQEGLAMWHQVFGEGNFGGTISPEFDNLAVWGDSGSLKMWHPVVLVPAPGIYSARFELYLGDGSGQPLEGWSSAGVTLSWAATAVPEPMATALLAAAAGAAFTLLRRNRRRSGH